jgi:hypothetical protein
VTRKSNRHALTLANRSTARCGRRAVLNPTDDLQVHSSLKSEFWGSRRLSGGSGGDGLQHGIGNLHVAHVAVAGDELVREQVVDDVVVECVLGLDVL